MSNYEHHVGKIKLVDENFTKEKLEKILSEDDIDEENTLEENIEIKNNQYVHSSPIARDVSKIEIIKLTNKYREECMRKK